MNRIEKISDKLRVAEKPSLYRIDRVKINKEDIIVVCAGFEDRATEILKRLLSVDSTSFNALIVEYLPYYKENRIEEVRQLCQKHNIRTISFIYDRQNPAGAGERIANLLENVQGNIFIDVSAMSRLLIVQTIVAFGNSARRLKNVEIVYSEALKYPPSKDKVDIAIKQAEETEGDCIYRTMFLSSGVYEVAIVPELSSITLQGQPIRLVTFPSFNRDQLVALYGEIQPSYISLIHGIPLLDENKWRPGAIKKLNATTRILQREDIDTSTIDYSETLEQLLDIYDNHGQMERVILAPTGSKMQSVAVGIFRYFINDVQIVYPTPKVFTSPKEYTEGVRNIYSLSLNPFSLISHDL